MLHRSAFEKMRPAVSGENPFVSSAVEPVPPLMEVEKFARPFKLAIF